MIPDAVRIKFVLLKMGMLMLDVKDISILLMNKELCIKVGK
jgi:hypothetical protein